MNSFFRELKRRNVYKVAVGYAVVGWLLVQIASTILPTFHAPEGFLQGLVILVAMGFPVVLLLAWAFEMTPGGMKRTEAILPNEHIPQWSRRKFAFFVAGTAFVAAALLAFQLVRNRIVAGSGILSVAAKSIAVLPFENRSEDKANAFFADGIQDEILTRLAKIADLKVISRTSTQRYKSSPENLPVIARELGVEHVLEGSVQKVGQQIRVTVQLINGATDSHLWAETYDRSLTDIFAVESEIASSIAGELQAKLTPNEQKAVTAKPTDNPEAYEEYLRGLATWYKLTSLPQDYDEMVTHFSRAVELDPRFALAWSFLSVAHSNQYRILEPTPRMAALAKEALERARALQPDLGETHFAEGMFAYKVLRDYDRALVAFEKARAHSSHRVEAIEFSAYVKRREGKWNDALRLHAESLEVDPRNLNILSEAALTYRALRRFEDAQNLIDRAREIEPTNPQLLAHAAELALAQGNVTAAGRLLEGVSANGADPEVTMAFVRFQEMQRQYPEAIHALESVLATPEKLPGAFPAIAANYRGELAIAQTLAGSPNAKSARENSCRELAAIHTKGGETNWSNIVLLILAGFQKDRTLVDSVAAQLRDRIDHDAVSRASLEQAIAIARANLGETDVALRRVRQLLQIPGEACLTQALLRLDPLWDPLRNHPGFEELAGPAF